MHKISKFIDSKKHAWSDVTKRKVRSDLLRYKDAITGDAEELWESISHLSPYSRVTLWTRVSSYWDFVSSGPNPYKAWREQNARQFKNAYKRKTPEITYSAAKEAIAKIQDVEVRGKAMQLLVGGLRWSESFTVTEQGYCIGKGGKSRKVFVPPIEYTKSKSYFEKELKKVLDVTVHDLRKIRMTDLARQGLPPEDLCKIAGWSNFNTAASYLAPAKDDELARLFK